MERPCAICGQTFPHDGYYGGGLRNFVRWLWRR